MRIDPRRKVRTVAGENIVIMSDGKNTDMTRVVALNESAFEIYNALKDREFEVDDVVQVLTESYDVDPATARSDAEEWLAEMRKNDMLV